MMTKTICEPIKLTVDSVTQLNHLIDSLINNYDICVEQIKDNKDRFYAMYTTKFKVELYERNNDE